MVTYAELLQDPVFWRQFGVGLGVLVVLVVLSSIYKKLKWLVLVAALGILLLLVYGQFFFQTYGTEEERGEVQETEGRVWQRLQRFSSEWLGF